MPALAAAPKPATSAPAGGKNLLVNGDFERLDKGGRLPEGWSTKHPANVRVVDVGDGQRHVVEMTGDQTLMGGYGTDLLSGKIPVKANTRYRCTGWARSGGPKQIVFVKGYATVTRRVGGEARTFEDVVYQMRKDIAPSPDWRAFDLDFEIKPAAEFSDFQQRVEYLRITLWAYWPAGTCWYDGIRFEEAGPVPASERRHGQAVTHAGLRPRLGAESQPGSDPSLAREGGSRAAFDEEQAWIDAGNAFRERRDEEALRLAERLVARRPGRGDYRLLAARVLARLGRWAEADKHAQWLLEVPASPPAEGGGARQIEPWQQDWARVVHGEVLLWSGRREEAIAMLKAVAGSESASPHAREAAAKLLEEGPPRTNGSQPRP